MEKTIKTMLALMAGALTFSACSSEYEFAGQENSNGAKLVTLTAYQEGDATSRAAIGSTTGTSTTINWKSGDAIGVFASTGSSTQYTTTDDGKTSANFSGTEVTGAAYALYPYRGAAQSASDAISGVVIPTTQTATANSFDPDAAVMVGEISSGSVVFKNVCAFLKITTDVAYSKIVVTTNRNAPIAGTFKVTPSTGAATVADGKNVITLVPSSSATEIAAGTYYIAIAPSSTVMQFAVDCYTSNSVVAKEKVKYYTTAGSFERKKDYNLTGTGSTSSWDAYDTNLLPGWYSVSGDKLVHFTKGNLYWDSSAFKFEANQTDYDKGTTSGSTTTYTSTHVSHFFWSKTASVMYAASYSDASAATDDAFFFCYANKDRDDNKVDGKSGYYALTGGDNGEYKYLITTRGTSLYKYGVQVTYNSTSYTNCLIIAPDGFTGTLESTYTLDAINNAGVVCLPAAGNRSGSSLLEGGSFGYYWSATPYSGYENRAYHLDFYSGYVSPASSNYRNTGCTLRLVK